MRQVETDVLIIGGGISAALIAEKLTEERNVDVLIVEAGEHSAPLEDRQQRRHRFVSYGENPWTHDHIEDQSAEGIMSRSMVVGGQALHWGGVVPRFSPEDFRLRSLFGVHTDWPIDYDTLEPYYLEAEERIGVAGEQGPAPLDPRAQPYPMRAVPLTWTLERLREWMDSAGVPTWTTPVAKNTEPWRGRNVCQRCDTCNICPTGAKYSPDFTFAQLLEADRIRLQSGTLIRRLELAAGSDGIHAAVGRSYDDPDTDIVFRAQTFVLAGGYTWSPHLLMLSANDRYPAGLANSSGTLGRYMAGHRNVSAFVELPMRLLPGMYYGHSLLSKYFQRPQLEGGPGLSNGRYVRHDFRVWESTVSRGPRLRDDSGGVLLGDDVMADWKARTATGTTRLRSYYDVIPDRESRIVLRPRDHQPLRRPHAETRVSRRPGLARRAWPHGGPDSRKLRACGAFRKRTCAAHLRGQHTGPPRRRLPHGRRCQRQRGRLLGAHARSRKPLRGRRANARIGWVQQRDAHILGVVTAFGGGDRSLVSRRKLVVLTSST